uniref:Short ORF that may control RAR delta 1 isoform production n=1 Tax=Notophthalmus viridescens TaxID=8316 RepID=Q65ZF0_NOTVI|nr:short ORF that may control RAR delta 1 isoform production [Notophthalmus viridescens]
MPWHHAGNIYLPITIT